MALIPSKQTQTFLVLGFNAYVGQRGARCYVTAIDEYAEQTADQIGCYALSMGIPFTEKDKIAAQKPSFTNPLLVVFEGRNENRAGNMQFVVDAVQSVAPFKVPSAKAEQVK